MKKLLFKTVMGLGLITSVIFTSCAKKSEDPKPNSVVIVTPPTTIKNDSLRSPYYILDNDTSMKFIEKYNGKTLKFIDPSPNGYKDTLLVSFNLKLGSNVTNVIENKVKCLDVYITNNNGLTFNKNYFFFQKNTFVNDLIFNMNLSVNPWLYVENNINKGYVGDNLKIIKNDTKTLILNFSIGGRELRNYQTLL